MWLTFEFMAILGFGFATIFKQSAMAISIGLGYVLVVEALSSVCKFASAMPSSRSTNCSNSKRWWAARESNPDRVRGILRDVGAVPRLRT